MGKSWNREGCDAICVPRSVRKASEAGVSLRENEARAIVDEPERRLLSGTDFVYPRFHAPQMSTLLHILSKDALRVSELEEVLRTFRSSRGLIVDTVSAIRRLEPEFAYRAVWLLRRLAQESLLEAKTLRRIAEAAEETTHWLTRLCLCQLFSDTGCPREIRECVFPFLVECFADKRVLIRAWAISALATFGADARYRMEFEAMLAQAKRDTSKAMKARLRHLPSPVKAIKRK